MREILFRGKRIDNGEWVDGYLYEHEPELVGIVSENDVQEPSKWFITRTGFADWNMPRPVEFVEVNPSTVGQYTGLEDKNGKRIFEGDILKSHYDSLFPDDVTFDLVVFCDSAWCIQQKGFEPVPACADMISELSEVAGNIYDNPELLERGTP